MNGIKTITSRLGFGQSPMPQADPNAKEGTCPLCGTFGPLSKMGWCYDSECKSKQRNELRRQAKEQGGVVDGLYYRVGDTELINLAALETCAEPVTTVKHPDLCTEDGCEIYARPNDSLCPHHRAETNLARAKAIRKARQGKARKQKGRNRSVGNRIKGWDKLG